MLDKIDRRYFSGTDVAAIANSLSGTLYQWGIQVQQVGPNSWSGRGAQGSYSMLPKVGFTIAPIQDGMSVDIRISADIDNNGIIILVIAWLFFFPIAVVLGILAYQDWERRSTELMGAVWAPLANRMIAPPAPNWGPPAMGVPPPGAGYGGPPR
jgi:hypothetical protein